MPQSVKPPAAFSNLSLTAVKFSGGCWFPSLSRSGRRISYLRFDVVIVLEGFQKAQDGKSGSLVQPAKLYFNRRARIDGHAAVSRMFFRKGRGQAGPCGADLFFEFLD